METLLRDLEYFATQASLKNSSYGYPKKDLDEMWQDTMLAQFHDCLPGTTIKMVVNDNLDIYARRGEQARGLIERALRVLSTGKKGVHVIDPLRLRRDEIVLRDGKFGRLITDAQGRGSVDFHPKGLQPATARQNGASHTLENAKLRLTVESGRITSLFDKQVQRELILAGPRSSDAGWMVFEDYPLNYDAWDVEIYHLKSYENICFDRVEVKNEELRSSLVAFAKFGKSSVQLTVS